MNTNVDYMAGYLAQQEGKARDKNIFVKEITPEAFKQWDEGWRKANKEYEEWKRSR